MRDWMADIKQLPIENIYVQHEPFTPRYSNALIYLRKLVHFGDCLGFREVIQNTTIEIAVWLELGTKRRTPGIYCCFRLTYTPEMHLRIAVLFCFYDGTEKSPIFYNKDSATVYARNEGFRNG